MAKHFDEVYWMCYDSYEDLKLFEVGCQKCPPGYSFGPVVRDTYLLHYVFAGEGTLYMDGQEFSVHEKQAFFLPANVLTFYQASDENPWNYIWIHVHGYKALDMFRQAGLTRKTPVYVPKEPCDAIGECMKEILKHYDKEYECMGNLYRLFQLLIDNSSVEIKPEMKAEPALRYIRMVIDYITQKYSEPIRIKDIADYCGLERSYLSKVFKYATGFSPQEYLLHYRLEKAKKLLRDSKLPVQHISYAVGYNDPFSFSKLFKRETGMSPRQWRKENELNSEE